MKIIILAEANRSSDTVKNLAPEMLMAFWHCWQTIWMNVFASSDPSYHWQLYAASITDELCNRVRLGCDGSPPGASALINRPSCTHSCIVLSSDIGMNVFVFLHSSPLQRVFHKSGTIARIEVLTQLLRNMLNMSTSLCNISLTAISTQQSYFNSFNFTQYHH